MELFKKEREHIRRLFIKGSKNLELALTAKIVSNEQVLASLRQLEDKIERIFTLDELIRENLFSSNPSEEDLTQEFDQIEFYREQIIKYRSKCEVVLKEKSMHDDQKSSSYHNDADNNRKFRLPRLELKKFDGNVKNWIGFWGQFKKIHEDEKIDPDDKFQYLLQATEPGTVARDLIESFPPSGSNYSKAIDQMKVRFARDEFLIEVYVRELLDLVLKQATKTRTGMTLASLYDKIETQLRALETLGVTRDKYAAMLFPLVESALPEELLKVWERYRSMNPADLNEKFEESEENKGNFNKTNILSMLLDFLRREVESEERINLAQTSFGVGKESSKNQKTTYRMKDQKQSESEIYTASALYSANMKGQQDRGKNIPICLFCDKSHASQECFKAQKLTLEERKAKVMSKRACFTCLKRNHTSHYCKAFIRCLICTKRHYPIMCSDLRVSNESKTDDPNQKVENVLTNNLRTDTLLQTVLVRLVNDGKEKVVRTLLDSASQRSYILSKCATDLGYVKSGVENIIQGVFGGLQTPPKIHGIFDIVVQNLDRNFEMKLSVLEQEKICNYIPRLEDSLYISHLKRKNIILNEIIVKNAPRDIELLLGADIFGKLLTGNLENLDDHLFAIETHLGWTVMGQQTNSRNEMIFSGVTNCSLADLWTLDVLGIKDPVDIKTKKDLEYDTIEYFNETISINEDARYEVRLPWISDHSQLSSNEHIAEIRLLSTTKKLLHLRKFEAYERVLIEWEKLGIIEEIRGEEDSGKKSSHYLPHHAVFKESSNTTKIRPVFDASAKDENGNSLNNCLQTGPNLIELIPTLLLKFRLGMIGVTADIEKAFLQISISPHDRDFLRFFWWHNHTENKRKTYRHCRVVFGVKPSPFLLAATINYHLSRAPDNLKDTAEKLKESFYVDNCITSFNNEHELEKFVRESKELMSSGNFNLRDWISNIDNELCDIAEENVISVLGMLWNKRDDVLSCDLGAFSKLQNIPKTRRGLLSVAQRIFDPIGFTCPFTLIPKMLLQDTWQLKTGWDNELPDNLMKRLNTWLEQTQFIPLCKVPRSLSFKKQIVVENSTIHIFCDSSKAAYAACVFIRIELDDMFHVQMLQAKSRIAPKNITIPRLELLACVIGVRLGQAIKKVRELSSLKYFYWTDSMVALTWIKTVGTWKTFVDNRVKEIRSVTNVEQWNHVSGNLNPADVASRGCSGKSLMENKWWEGPQWLRKSQEYWPNSVSDYPENEVDEERKRTAVSNVVHENDFVKRLLNFSKFSKIIRTIAWIWRFYNNISRKFQSKSQGQLKYNEIKYAKNSILRLIQRESFKNKPKIQNLEYFEDEEGLLRVKTRLILGEDPHNFKYPIILPSVHGLVDKLILQQHELNQHAGVKTLLCILRETFWILRGRQTVKKIISKCIICKRFTSKSVDTPIAPLPRNRINQAAAFEISGVDLAGPLFLKGGDKVWIVLFTCALYRAIHLELVKSLSTDSFLLALRRFLARRGRVSTIYSDNGTNFVGANNLLKNVEWIRIEQYSSAKQIEWIFNPPTAAWWGGWWERLVRVIKELLRRNLGRAIVNFEEMMTILCDCESIINSRPLTYISENEDLIPLSPSMFIQDIPSSETPDLDNIDTNHIKSRFRYLQKIRDGIRTRFRKEYLAELVQSGHRKPGTLKVGDIVYVASDNVKRLNWPLGRIVEVILGRDGIARIARVKVHNGEILRPFQRLYPLEISGEENNVRFEYPKKSETEGGEKKKIEESVGKKEVNQKKILKKEKENKPVITRSGRTVHAPKQFSFQIV